MILEGSYSGCDSGDSGVLSFGDGDSRTGGDAVDDVGGSQKILNIDGFGKVGRNVNPEYEIIRSGLGGKNLAVFRQQSILFGKWGDLQTGSYRIKPG